jgi:MarR family transcriptional regulator, organic hydroperoxide resistance regulator
MQPRSRRERGCIHKDIANLLAIDTAAVARSVKTMEQKGYIRIEHSQDDKRIKALYLSDSGKELYQFLRQLNNQWVDYVLSNLDAGEIKDFIWIIENISDRAKAFAKENPCLFGPAS